MSLTKNPLFFLHYRGPSPLKISSPPELKGMTLEERLVTYDWKTNFQTFADATRTGTFKPLCSSTNGTILPETSLESHYPRIIWPYQDPKVPCTRKPQRNKLSMLLSEDGEIGGVDGSDESNAVERGQLVRNKVSRSSDASSSLAGGSAARCASVALIVALLAVALR